MPTLTPLFDALESRFGKSGLLSDSNDLRLYEYDGGVDRHLPDVVVFPRTTEDVVFVVKAAKEHGVSIVGRGAGTGLSGGSIPQAGGIVVSFSRMNRILEIDLANERAIVEPGVVNLDITRASKRRAISSRRTRPANAPARLAGTLPRTPADRTRLRMASPPITLSAWNAYFRTEPC